MNSEGLRKFLKIYFDEFYNKKIRKFRRTPKNDTKLRINVNVFLSIKMFFVYINSIFLPLSSFLKFIIIFLFMGSSFIFRLKNRLQIFLINNYIVVIPKTL